MRIALGRLKALVRETLAPSESIRVRQESADADRAWELGDDGRLTPFEP